MEGCQEIAQTSSLLDGLTSSNFRWEDVLWWYIWINIGIFHAAIKHYWILQRSQCLAGILFCQCICPHTTFSAQRFFTSTKDTCSDVSLTGTATTNSHCFLGDLDNFRDWARTLFRTPRLRLSMLWTTPAAPENDISINLVSQQICQAEYNQIPMSWIQITLDLSLVSCFNPLDHKRGNVL